MSFVRHRVPLPLRPFVAEAHGYRTPANPTGVHRGLPSRHLTLVVELAAPLRITGLGQGVAAHAVLGGLHTRPALIDASRPQDGLQYALTPLAATALFGLPAVELREDVVDLSAVIGRAADRLVADLAAARSWAERFTWLDAALLERLPGSAAPAPPEVREAWRLLCTRDGRYRTSELAVQVGWSRRHLSTQFRLATGLTPKQGSLSRAVRGHPPGVAGPATPVAGRRGRSLRLRRPGAPASGMAGPGRMQRGDVAARGVPISSRRRGRTHGTLPGMTTPASTDRTPRLDGPPAPCVWPSVGFRDVDAGMRFLTDGLGFVVTACYQSEDGTVEHAEARWPDGGGVMFGSRGKPGDWGALGPQGVYVVAADPATVDAAWERLRSMPGVEVLHPLHDTDYGSHQFDVRDADGNLWTLGTYRGA